MIVFERAGLLFVFNFHPTQSFADYRVGVEVGGEYECVLSSDEERYGGWGNVKEGGKYFTTAMEWNGRKNWVQVCLFFCFVFGSGIGWRLIFWVGDSEQVYVPTRTCIVLAKVG
jgi:1,4-alpha-glucan branching enzyme